MKLSFSFRNLDDNTAATRTLSAPKGVTRAAGANAYARRFAASPIPTETKMYLYIIKYRCHINKMIMIASFKLQIGTYLL